MIYSRDNVLFSFDYKSQQEDYFTSEIRAIVDKIGTNEGLIQEEDGLNFRTADLMNGFIPDWKKSAADGLSKLSHPKITDKKNTGADIMFKNASHVFDPEVIAEMRDLDLSQMNNNQ